jgi:hypothetical protein
MFALTWPSRAACRESKIRMRKSLSITVCPKPCERHTVKNGSG